MSTIEIFGYGKDKIYYWCRYNEHCVAFIAIKDYDEPDNLWTVWSGHTESFSDETINDEIKQVALSHIDFGCCGSNKPIKVFGIIYEGVCGTTFRIDNPTMKDLPFLKKMVELGIRDVINENK